MINISHENIYDAMPGSLSIGFSLPGRYAKALLDFKSKDFLKDFDVLLGALKSDALTVSLLKAQHLKRHYLMEFVDVVSGILKLQKEFSSFLKLLIENNRFCLLEDIARCYQTLWKKKNNIKHLDIHSAVKLSKEEQLQVEKEIKKFFSENLKVTHDVDESLLGGLLVETDGVHIDTSVKNHIKKLEQAIRA